MTGIGLLAAAMITALVGCSGGTRRANQAILKVHQEKIERLQKLSTHLQQEATRERNAARSLRKEKRQLAEEIAAFKRRQEEQKIALAADRKRLKAIFASRFAETDIRNGSLVLTLTGVFDPGSATIKPTAMGLIRRLGSALQLEFKERQALIMGHTDNAPIRGGPFKDHWELSTERAVVVAKLLLQQARVAPGRLLTGGAGKHRPIASNDHVEGRARNRRIEVWVWPR